MKVIDPHVHLFELTLGQYRWLQPNNAPFWPDKSLINRNFGTKDLALPTPFEQLGVVHIEAGFNNQEPWKEVEWLEKTVTTPLRTIATADITEAEDKFNANLTQLRIFRSVVGVRHILDEDVEAILTHPNAIKNLQQLAKLGWIFELQFNANHFDDCQTCLRIFKQVPKLKITLEHAGFILGSSDRKTAAQFSNLSQLALIDNLMVKCSGWEMTSRDFLWSQVENTISLMQRTFGHERVMLASNFPLCLFRHSYQDYWQNMNNLKLENKTALFYKNAAIWYGF